MFFYLILKTLIILLIAELIIEIFEHWWFSLTYQYLSATTKLK